MNLEDLKNKTVLLFGKPRAFSLEEFDVQMKHHQIGVTQELSDAVVLSVDGRMMTPYEQLASDELYEKGAIKSMSIDALEAQLAREIDADTLLMSLKLSHDKERLKSFIQNSMISDALFFRLLKMYDWVGEDFFENDDNRDVSAAFIARFYENIERNHNVQYATTGFIHLVSQTQSSELLESIASLEPLKYHPKLRSSIAVHTQTPKNVLKRFVKSEDVYIKTLIAMRNDCDKELQSLLLKSEALEVLEALSYNANLDKSIIILFLEKKKLAYNMARHLHLNDELFELLKEYPEALAHNETLSVFMQEKLVYLQNQEVNIALAKNDSLADNLVDSLISMGSDDINYAIYSSHPFAKKEFEEAYQYKANHVALASNKNTPSEILTLLFESENSEVLEYLAKNESTPTEILYQLHLDSRFERYVRTNKGFGKHIQSENIGWMV